MDVVHAKADELAAPHAVDSDASAEEHRPSRRWVAAAGVAAATTLAIPVALTLISQPGDAGPRAATTRERALGIDPNQFPAAGEPFVGTWTEQHLSNETLVEAQWSIDWRSPSDWRAEVIGGADPSAPVGEVHQFRNGRFEILDPGGAVITSEQDGGPFAPNSWLQPGNFATDKLAGKGFEEVLPTADPRVVTAIDRTPIPCTGLVEKVCGPGVTTVDEEDVYIIVNGLPVSGEFRVAGELVGSFTLDVQTVGTTDSQPTEHTAPPEHVAEPGRRELTPAKVQESLAHECKPGDPNASFTDPVTGYIDFTKVPLWVPVVAPPNGRFVGCTPRVLVFPELDDHVTEERYAIRAGVPGHVPPSPVFLSDGSLSGYFVPGVGFVQRDIAEANDLVKEPMRRMPVSPLEFSVVVGPEPVPTE